VTPQEKAVVQAAIEAHGIGHLPSTAQSTILRQAVHTLIFTCPECNTDRHTCPGCGENIGHGDHACAICSAPPTPETDYVTVLEPADECQCPRTEKVYCHAENCQGGADVTALEPIEPAPEWVPTEWLHVLPGDHVRLNGQEADVATLRVGDWHADITSRLMESGRWWDSITAWDHKELYVRLAHLDAELPFPPSSPVEILMDRTRQAQHLLQTAFPGTRAA
jgi:hypothetical protein